MVLDELVAVVDGLVVVVTWLELCVLSVADPVVVVVIGLEL